MAFMNARKRNKVMTYVIVGFVSVGLLLSVSLYWTSGSSGNYASGGTGTSLEAAAVQDFTDGANLLQQNKADEATKKLNDAIKKFEEVLKTNPNNVPVLGDMATAYFYTGNTDKAIEVAKKALQLDPNFTPARLNLSRYLASGKNNTVEAVNELKKIPSSDPDYAQAQELIKEFSSANTLPPQGGGSLPPQGGGLAPQQPSGK